MFMIFRLFRHSSPWVRWLVVGLVTAGGVALVVFGLMDHITILVVRGAILLVVAVLAGVRMLRPTRVSRGGGSGQFR